MAGRNGDDDNVAREQIVAVRDQLEIVNPDSQNQGIGTRLLHEIEKYFPEAERYKLFTGHKSQRNLYLYQKLGYRPFKRQRINDMLPLVFLEKENDRLKNI